MARTQRGLNNGRIEEDMSGVAVPITQHGGQDIAAFSISAINTRLSGDRRDQAIELLREQAEYMQKCASAVLATRSAQRHSKKLSLYQHVLTRQEMK